MPINKTILISPVAPVGPVQKAIELQEILNTAELVHQIGGNIQTIPGMQPVAHQLPVDE